MLLIKLKAGEGKETNLESQEYDRKGSFALSKCHSLSAKVWPTSGGRSIGMVRSRTQATKFSSGGRDEE
jgi:hypothetical protein